ncbi:hypothetical protein FRUB_00882 [Fimbriiglobus ruber]|uniref:Uncharacterized protein n=1 Tax=Fimbriiglobus ruber TaxID=1908690 RepID=A0A225E1T2_9BACT|nr:hypothetical protein FRUB_00882 [Fimbriiglobus ruber]
MPLFGQAPVPAPTLPAAPPNPPPAQTDPGVPVSERPRPLVLLLDTFQIVEGEVARVGDDYELRQGKEIRRFPQAKVVFAGESRDAVQKYLLARASNPTPLPPAAGTPPPSGEVNAAALQVYPTKIQPVLMNMCAKCHCRPDHASRFKLARVPEGYANTESARRNIETTVAFLSRENPTASPLLTKALTKHGGQREAAFRTPTHPAYQNLELWAYWATLPNGSPLPDGIPATAVVAKPAPVSAPGSAASATPALLPTSVTAAAPQQPVVPASATKPAASADPYDPAVFNKTAQPNR